MKICVTVCATEAYSYAITSQAEHVAANFMDTMKMSPSPLAILVSDNSLAMKRAADIYKESGFDVSHITGSFNGKAKNYEQQAQLSIAQMRTAAFKEARKFDADFCWSLDSDVLPKPNSLRCMLDMLRFDDGFYSVAACPYPSQGGGSFLCGRGIPTNPILPDWEEKEQKIPDDLRKEIDEARKARVDCKEPTCPEDWKAIEEADKRLRAAEKKLRECPPQGNVFEMNGKHGWRRRGWFENAYPGIGRGSVVPSDWCGFGCTMMKREALRHAIFAGYEGGGTEDLFICFHRWFQQGLRICAIPHCPADHVVRNPGYKEGENGKYVLCSTWHEHTGESVGHLRMTLRPWYSHTPGEVFDPKNNGRIIHPKVDSPPPVE